MKKLLLILILITSLNGFSQNNTKEFLSIRVHYSLTSEGIKNEEGEDVSTIEIKNILEKLISNENKKKPLADQALSALLKEKGYSVARRTVAKYREQMDIPVARLRKSI